MTLCIIAGNVIPNGYEAAFSLTFMHIHKITNEMGASKDEFMAALEELAAAGLQDYYIDDLGNLTVIQYPSGKPIQNHEQPRREQGKARRPRRRKKR